MSLRWRRGGAGGPGEPPPEPPPGGEAFGPTDGAASVRAGAGARTVLNPGGGISFNSSGSLQSAINANAAGSTFICSVNAPLWNTQVDTGTKAPTIIFPGTVGQKIIEGNGQQFIPMRLNANATIKGGTWRNFGGASTIHGIRLIGENATVEDAVVADIWDSGIEASASGGTIRYCTLHANGMDGYASSGDGATNLTMHHNHIFSNNTRLVSPGFQAGAGKIVGGSDGGPGHFHHNWAHDNVGFGIWWDTSCSNWLIEENVTENNHMAGLFYEANYGSVIRRNLVLNNGRNASIGATGPFVENLTNVRLSDNACNRVAQDGLVHPLDFSFNLVDHTGSYGGNTGALLQLWDHTDSAVRHVSNTDIHDNQFWLRSSATPMPKIRNTDQDLSGGAPFTTNYQLWNLDNVYRNNQYRVVNLTSSFWMWGSGVQTGSAVSFAAWQAIHTQGETRVLI